VTNLSSTPVGPPPTTTCKVREVTKSENSIIKLYQPCVIVDQPLRNVVQGTRPSLNLEGMSEGNVKVELNCSQSINSLCN